jgi:glycerol-3-phosphate O-acyltransferase
LKGSPHHFFWYLPTKKGGLLSWLQKQFYSGIRIDADQIDVIENIPRNAYVVYVNKHRSQFEYLFYHNRFTQLGLRVPEVGLDYRSIFLQTPLQMLRVLTSLGYHLIVRRKVPDPYDTGYVDQHLSTQNAAMLALIGEKAFNRRFVKKKTGPVQHLVRLQSRIEQPIYLVPLVMFLGRKPKKQDPSSLEILFGNSIRPSILSRIYTMFSRPDKVFVEAPRPINLKQLLATRQMRGRHPDNAALMIREQLLDQINSHRQAVTGPLIKSHQELKEAILTNQRLQAYMSRHAETKDIPLRKVHKEARGYVDEIAARYSPAFVNFAAPIVGWIINTMYDGVTVNHRMITKLKDAARQGPLILIPCHKSHMDYLVIPYMLYSNNMPSPHIVAGKNMFFWPFGRIARAGGGFSIRRTFRGAAFYARVFSEYVHALLSEGFNIKLFVEGTRSRSGKLLPPKLGFLSLLISAYRNGACKDMSVVPIFVGYDKVIEEGAYLEEAEGGEKEPENVFQVIRARKFLKSRYGRIYLNLHEPISLSRLQALCGIDLMDAPQKEINGFTRELGFRIINAIDKVSMVTPHTIVAAALLNHPKEMLSYAKIEAGALFYLSYLVAQKVHLADTLTINAEHAITQVVEDYVQRGFIDRVSGNKKSPVTDLEFKVVENKRIGLDYYKNGCIIFFVPAAFTAMAILARDAFQFSAVDLHETYRQLRSLLKNEFAYDIDVPVERVLRKCIKTFIDSAILIPHPTLPDTYNLTSSGFRALKRYASFLKTYFESYLVVLKVQMQTPRKDLDPKRRTKKIISVGSRLYKKGEITRKEALSKINFENALYYFGSKGIHGAENADLIQRYLDLIENNLKYLT